MSEKYETSKTSNLEESHSDRILGETGSHQKGFELPVGPLSDPWQFRIYLESLIIRKNNV
jgi:hypothetical protein